MAGGPNGLVARARRSMARNYRQRGDQNTQPGQKRPEVYEEGDQVKISKTGHVGTVTNVASWGDYKVDGVGWYSAKALEPVP